jgi:cytochrome c2
VEALLKSPAENPRYSVKSARMARKFFRTDKERRKVLAFLQIPM